MARLAVCLALLLVCMASAQDNPLAALEQQAASEFQTISDAEMQMEHQALDAASQLDGIFTGAATNAGQQIANAESQLIGLAASEVNALVNGMKAIEQTEANAVAAAAGAA